jgi:hypothetical protein
MATKGHSSCVSHGRVNTNSRYRATNTIRVTCEKANLGLILLHFQYCIVVGCYKICIYDLYDFKHEVGVLLEIMNEGNESSSTGRLVMMSQLLG